MPIQVELDGDSGTVLADMVRLTCDNAASIVRIALHEKQERLYRQRRAEFRLAELKEILRRLNPAPGKRTYMSNGEGDAWLYDENGLPH